MLEKLEKVKIDYPDARANYETMEENLNKFDINNVKIKITMVNGYKPLKLNTFNNTLYILCVSNDESHLAIF